MKMAPDNKIHSILKPAGITGILWYRIRKHPMATLFSAFFAFALAWLLCFVIGEIYPGFKAHYKTSFPFRFLSYHGTKYTFYSGEDSGVYSAVGKAVTNDAIDSTTAIHEKIGLFRYHDSLRNCPTGGGFDNFMKVSTEKNSFGLVQEAVINLQDEQLRKGILVETPLFMERLHIFYRKNLFSKFIPADETQLSANTDSRILKCISSFVKNIQVGGTGSCTRIIASDVMDLLERQIAENPETKKCKHQYKLYDYPLSIAMKKMHQYGEKYFVAHKPDSVIDIMFLVGADPTDDITKILNCGAYRMMSVHPSFMGLLNKEFRLNLHVADFHKKYDSAEHINTVGTLSFLIASGDVQSDNVKRMLRKIRNSISVIHKSLITLPAGCNNSCYSGKNDTCKYTLPLSEFGFYKRFEEDDLASGKEETKAMIPFLVAMVSLFFPVLKSLSRFKSVWWIWYYNKRIDELLPAKEVMVKKELLNMRIKITDLYGECELSEDHYNALTKRIDIYMPGNIQEAYKKPKTSELSLANSK